MLTLKELILSETAHLEFLYHDACSKGHWNEANRIEYRLGELKILLKEES